MKFITKHHLPQKNSDLHCAKPGKPSKFGTCARIPRRGGKLRGVEGHSREQYLSERLRAGGPNVSKGPLNVGKNW